MRRTRGQKSPAGVPLPRDKNAKRASRNLRGRADVEELGG